ncbi:hypothetical protein [Sulfitobacter aestuariivivens]|uniref:hypothetical protein n=1 Tax=Sulfitobacter aestuariivivens TaxID=2766981 RepID=UPI00361E8C4B
MRLGLLAIGALVASLIAGSMAAQEAPAPTPAPSANDLHEFTRLLADPRIQKWIADQANTAEVVDRSQPPTCARTWCARLTKPGAGWSNWPQLAGLAADRQGVCRPMARSPVPAAATARPDFCNDFPLCRRGT